MSDRTKKQLSKALLELSKNHRIEDISIKDITDYCELNRVSFYYHFKDKQDLMRYIYANFKKTLNLAEGHQKENTRQLILFMQEYPDFFKQAFQETGQNNFKTEFIEMMEGDYKIMLENKNNHTARHTQDFLALFFAYATVDMFEYIINSNNINIDEIVDDFEYAMNVGFR